MNETKVETVAHTPGPWAVETVDTLLGRAPGSGSDSEAQYVKSERICGPGGDYIGITDAYKTAGAFEIDEERNAANARRIVSCVNALRGVAEPETALRAVRAALVEIAGTEWTTMTAERIYELAAQALAALPEGGTS